MLSSRLCDHSDNRSALLQSGLAMTSMAPIWSAVTARSAWAVQRTTGSGCCRMSLRRKVRPSIRGISTSSTITPGTDFPSIATASYGSAASTTRNPGSDSMMALSRCLTTALSSTTRTSKGAGSWDGCPGVRRSRRAMAAHTSFWNNDGECFRSTGGTSGSISPFPVASQPPGRMCCARRFKRVRRSSSAK